MIIEDVIQDVISDPIQDIIVAGYPPILDTAFLWLKDTGIIDSASTITDWLNEGTGGAGYNLPNVASNPQLSTQNGIKSVFFDGTADSMRPATSNFTAIH